MKARVVGFLSLAWLSSVSFASVENELPNISVGQIQSIWDLKEGHVKPVESGRVLVRHTQGEMSLDLTPGFFCPKDLHCAQVMPERMLMRFRITKSSVDQCGVLRVSGTAESELLNGSRVLETLLLTDYDSMKSLKSPECIQTMEVKVSFLEHKTFTIPGRSLLKHDRYELSVIESRSSSKQRTQYETQPLPLREIEE
jgi:hypothetical protein